MPSRVTFRENDRSQVPFQVIAKPVADLLSDLSGHRFRLVIEGLNWWSDFDLFEVHYPSWAARFLPNRNQPDTEDLRIDRVLSTFYREAKVKADEGVKITLPNGTTQTVEGQGALGKFRAEVLEQYAQNARSSHFDAVGFGKNCVFLVNNRPALPFILDVDVAGWKNDQGEASSCKCRPTNFTTRGLKELLDLRQRLELEFQAGCLQIYLITFDSTVILEDRIWELSEGPPFLNPDDYHAIGFERLPHLKKGEPYRYLSA
ncbi:MAG TPA: hypothetical protein VD973_11895 [Symbiobacteriaceae bacterium]|nr:hypothetical protein [Symbiobacteriaceae bacterium]